MTTAIIMTNSFFPEGANPTGGAMCDKALLTAHDRARTFRLNGRAKYADHSRSANQPPRSKRITSVRIRP
ncbi:hypothetical protein [Sphingomonas faeni]|uniref:hypothetical protein n=1 Tax=Sphingomonas faeni TaxID=185950 RepID=UPI0027D8D7AD|nr:hypothetical protein [Sphingomonas faeni]